MSVMRSFELEQNRSVGIVRFGESVSERTEEFQRTELTALYIDGLSLGFRVGHSELIQFVYSVSIPSVSFKALVCLCVVETKALVSKFLL